MRMRRVAAGGRPARRRRCTSRQGLPLSPQHATRTMAMWSLAAMAACLLSWHVLRSCGCVMNLSRDMHLHALRPGCWLFRGRYLVVHTYKAKAPKLRNIFRRPVGMFISVWYMP